MNPFKTLIYEKTDSIGFITLNRPEALNAYSVQMRDDLYEVMGAVRDDDEIRVVIIKGAGEKAFCAGADLSEFLTAPPPVAARKVRFDRDIWGRLLNIPQPLIAVLHGYVLGSGIEIALCCDIRIAGDNARFALPEVGLGIIPAAGGSQTVPRAVCRGKALELMFTGQLIDAREALRINLINRVVPNDRKLVTAVKLARKIASLDPVAVQATKQAVNRGIELSLEEGLRLEKRLAFRLHIKKMKKREDRGRMEITS